MSQYHPLIQPPSAESAQHQDACGIRNNPLYTAWAILAQVYTALAKTRAELEAMPPTWKVRFDLGDLHRAMIGVADRRDMVWAFYAQEARRAGAPANGAPPAGTCKECKADYVMVSNDPRTQRGLCPGCADAEAEADQDAPTTRQPDNTGGPPDL
jgi:hypothetical protein